MPRIYISYRPEDSSRNEVAVIRQRLSDEFGEGNVLVSTGSPMETTIALQQQVQSCDMLLVVIGRWWLDMVDEEGNYLLNNPYDPIHVELYAGLQKRMTMQVLMVDGTPIPEAAQLPNVLQPLLNKDITQVSADNELNQFLDTLIEQLSSINSKTRTSQQGQSHDPEQSQWVPRRVRPRPTIQTGQTQNPGRRKYHTYIAVGIVVIVAAFIFLAISSVPDEPDDVDSAASSVPYESDDVDSVQVSATVEADKRLNTWRTSPDLHFRASILDIFSNQLAFSPDSRYLFAHNNLWHTTLIFDTETQSTIDTTLSYGVDDVVFISNTELAFFHEDDNEEQAFTVWDVKQDKPVIDAYPVDDLHISDSQIFSIGFGTEVILITTDGKLIRWWVSSEANSIVNEVTFDYDDALQYEIDVDGSNQAFTIHDGEQIRVYDLKSLELITTLAQPDPRIYYHTFMPDADAILLVDAQGNVSTWDYRDDTFQNLGQIDIVDQIRPYVRLRITYDPSQQYIYTSYLSRYARIDAWGINTMQRLVHYRPPSNHDVISDLFVSPDGQYLASMDDTVLYTIQE